MRQAENAWSMCLLTSRPSAPRAENTKRKSICLLKSRITAPRAEITDSTAPNRVRYALRRREHELFGQQTSASRAKNTKRESMRLLTNRSPAPRAEIAGFSVSPNRCVCPPQEMLRTAYGDDLCGQYMMCQHVLTDKIISNFAYGADRFYRPHSGFVLSAEARAVSRECGSIYLLTSRLPAPRAEMTGCAVSTIGYSAACGSDRFHRPIIRV